LHRQVGHLRVEHGERVRDDLGELILDVLKLFFPEQREEVVARILRQEPGFRGDVEEPDDFFVFDPGPQRQQPHPVLVQHPGEALLPARLVVDGLLAPDEVRLHDTDRDLGGRRPDREERVPNSLFGPLIDRVIGQVDGERAQSLGQRPKQLLDLLDGERQFGTVGKGHERTSTVGDAEERQGLRKIARGRGLGHQSKRRGTDASPRRHGADRVRPPATRSGGPRSD
jgi:hypothetical protein